MSQSKFVLVWIALALSASTVTARAEDQIFGSTSSASSQVEAEGRLDVEPPSPLPSREQTAKGLTAAALNDPAVSRHLKRMGRCKASPVAATREECRFALDLKVGAPDGATVTFSVTPVLPLTLGVSAGGTGPTLSLGAEATVNILWRSNLTPVITVKFSNIYFTGLTDSLANDYVREIYGDQFTVRMAGKWAHAISGLGGLDWVSDGGLHLSLKGGIVSQLGATHGAESKENNLQLRGWWGPAAEFAIGGAF